MASGLVQGNKPGRALAGVQVQVGCTRLGFRNCSFAVCIVGNRMADMLIHKRTSPSIFLKN